MLNHSSKFQLSNSQIMKKKGLKTCNSSKSSQKGVIAIGEGEKLRKNKRKKRMESSQVEVCDVCGHIGFINALMYCTACSHTVVHQYCMGIPPGSIDDTYNWLCEYCSLSMKSEHQNSSFEESCKELALAHEPEPEQYKSATMFVEDKLEPLCILPPLLYQECSEHQCVITEIMPNTSSTFISHPLTSKEKHEPASFIHRNSRSCDGSHSQVAEGISVNVSLSLDYPFNDREESEASVSSLMEFPKEIMSGLVLLVSLSGKVFIQSGINFCSCLCPSIISMTNSCNAINSEKLVKEPEYTENADGLRIKRKRTTARVKFDLLQPLGPECKRVRNKRCKISSSFNTGVGFYKVAATPSTGNEGSAQTTNGLDAFMLRNTDHGSSKGDPSLDIDPLTRDRLQVEATNKICGINVKERAEAHDRFCDQG
ncbi:E3 ubiquitin-protein ligase Jade-2 [Bienertia sinuspersici]